MTKAARPAPLGLTSLTAYALPGVPSAMMLYAVGVIVPGFYASDIGLSAIVVGTVLLCTRLVDVGFEFTVGYFSDRTHSSAGRRKPWVVAGAIVIAIGFYTLMTPEPGAPWQRFFFSLLAFYLGWAMLTVPYDAWGSELAHDYASRATIFTSRATAAYIGSLLFSLIPILPIFASSEFSPDVMRFAAFAVAIGLALTVPIALKFAPAEPGAPPKPATLKGLFSAFLTNAPLRLYIVSATLCGLSNGVFAAVTYIYQTDYMGFASRVWLMLIVYLGANLIALPIWAPVVRRIGKHRSWALGLLLNSLCFPPMAFLAPGEASFLPTLALLGFAGATYSVVNVTTPAVLGDVVDHETLRTGINRAGGFFALQALITKLTLAVGAGAAFLVIGFFGFKTGTLNQTPGGVFGIQIAYIYIPALLNLATIFFLWRFPLDARAMSIIRRRLDALAWRASSLTAHALDPHSTDKFEILTERNQR